MQSAVVHADDICLNISCSGNGVDIQACFAVSQPSVAYTVKLGKTTAQFSTIFVILSLAVKLVCLRSGSRIPCITFQQQKFVFTVIIKVGNVNEGIGFGKSPLQLGKDTIWIRLNNYE